MLDTKFKKIIFFVAFLASIILSTYTYINHDKENLTKSNNQYNNLIKGDSAHYFVKARYFQKNLENNNFFLFSGEYQASFLYPILIGGFYHLFNENVFNTDEIKDVNPPNPTPVKLYFLILQSFFYFFSVAFLISKLDKLDKSVKNILILFLLFEPTIFQYHSLFMTESIYLSLLNFFIGIMLRPPIYLYKNFFLGIFLGIMYMLKTTSFYLLIPIFIYYLFFFKLKSLAKFFFISLGYLIVIFFIGYSNYERSGIFYFTPTQANDAIHWYLADPIYSKSKGIPSEEAYDIKKENEEKWINENNIDLNVEKDRIELSIFKKEYTLKIIKEAPIVTIKYVVWKTFQFLIINPLHLSSYLNMNMVDKDYWKIDNSKKKLYFSLSYSLLFYIIVVIGFIKSLKNLDIRINFLLLILSIYFTFLLGWTGGSRYNLPIIILLSLYFSFGLRQVIQKFTSK